MTLFSATSNDDINDFIGQLQSEINSANQIKMHRFEFRDSDSKSDYSSSDSSSDECEKSPITFMNHSEMRETRRRINFNSD